MQNYPAPTFNSKWEFHFLLKLRGGNLGNLAKQRNAHGLWSTRDFSCHSLKAISFFTPSRKPRGLAAAQLGARASWCTRRSGSPAGAELAACCAGAAMRRHHLWARLVFLARLSPDSWHSGSHEFLTECPSPAPCSFSKLSEGLIL